MSYVYVCWRVFTRDARGRQNLMDALGECVVSCDTVKRWRHEFECGGGLVNMNMHVKRPQPLLSSTQLNSRKC